MVGFGKEHRKTSRQSGYPLKSVWQTPVTRWWYPPVVWRISRQRRERAGCARPRTCSANRRLRRPGFPCRGASARWAPVDSTGGDFHLARVPLLIMERDGLHFLERFQGPDQASGTVLSSAEHDDGFPIHDRSIPFAATCVAFPL